MSCRSTFAPPIPPNTYTTSRISTAPAWNLGTCMGAIMRHSFALISNISHDCMARWENASTVPPKTKILSLRRTPHAQPLFSIIGANLVQESNLGSNRSTSFKKPWSPSPPMAYRKCLSVTTHALDLRVLSGATCCQVLVSGVYLRTVSQRRLPRSDVNSIPPST